MEEPNPVHPENNALHKKSKQEMRNLQAWQKKLLPWLVIMPTLLILLFIYLATRQMMKFNTALEEKQGAVIDALIPNPSDTALYQKLKGNMDYIRWISLAKMEEKVLDRRYTQGGLLLASRIFTKYLGFFTGMILAIVGAIFIVGKLQEDVTNLEGDMGSNIKIKLASSSPGIIFGVLGTVLMLTTILTHTEISISDQPLFLNPYNVQVNTVGEKQTPVLNQGAVAPVKQTSHAIDSLINVLPE